MAILARNKRGYFDYEVLEKYEAGLKLLGHEAKAVKNSQVSLKGSHITVRGQDKNQLPELYLVNAHISLYKNAGDVTDYDPSRPRKLLVTKKEIKYLMGKRQEKGLTLVPLRLYTKHGLVKLEFALAKGKRKVDKREDIKRKDQERKERELLKYRMRR